MTTELLTGRFAYSDTSSAMLEQFDAPENVGIRFNPEFGGLVRLEVTVKAKNKFDVYDRRSNHPGQRLAAYSSWIHRPISGYISSVQEAGANRVTYIAKGPAWRLEHELDTTVYAKADTITDTIQTILTDHAPHVSTNYDNIAINATTLGGWQPKTPQGTKPIDAIKQLIEKSDSSDNRYAFYLLDEPFSGTSLGQYVAYYKTIVGTSAIDWQVNRSDLTSIQPSTSIDNRVTDATVYYGTVTFTANGGSNTTATRASGSNITQGLKPGDRLTNIDDGSSATIVDVQATTLTFDGLSGGTADTVVNGDVCSIRLETPQNTKFTNSTTTSTLWDVETADFRQNLTSTTAAQFAALMVEDEPETDQPIVVGAPWILDGNGAQWPLWEPIIQGGGILRVSDLYPAAALFTNSLDKLSSFWISGLDYDHSSGKLRVQLDKPDSRLDVKLRRAKILGSEMVARGG